jgi:hypothetical protein
MKTTIHFFLICCLLAAFPAICFAQNGLSWSAGVSIAGATAGGSSPRIVLLPDGTPAAVWGGSSKIWFSKKPSGNAFLPPVQIGTGGILPGLYDFGGLDMAASGQRIFVVFEKFDQGIFCVRSEDGGATWQPPVTVWAATTGLAATISAIAVDAAGNPMVSFLKQKSNETEAVVQLVRSLDGGQTFTLSTNASAPADGDFVCECCYQDILPAGGDTVFVAFRNNRSNVRDMWVTRSTDGGTNFDTACDADAQDWVSNVCPFSGPKLARIAGDSLFTIWMAKTASGLRVFGSTLSEASMEKGLEFQFRPTNTGAAYNQNRPDVAGQHDTIAVVWEESGFTGTGQDIVCAFSTTGTTGLMTGSYLNLTATAGTQKLPQIAYRDGVFHLIYADIAQGLVYRRGEVVAPVSTTEPEAESPCQTCFGSLPLPADVDLAKVAQAEIFDLSGRVMKRWAGGFQHSQNDLDISELPTGIYVLQMRDAVGRTVRVIRFFKM